MKRSTKIVAVVLALALCITYIPSTKVDAKSKSIRFAGVYQRQLNKKEAILFDFQQYSSPEGKEVGSFEIQYYMKGAGYHNWGGGLIKKTGTNQYTLDGGMKLKVYKTKVVISKCKGYNGTYKLKKRYPLP